MLHNFHAGICFSSASLYHFTFSFINFHFAGIYLVLKFLILQIFLNLQIVYANFS